jgi:ribonuclease HI
MSTGPATIHIDGAARGNPGPAAYAFTIAAPGVAIVEENGLLGSTTNNVAEYTALLKALEKAAALGLARLHVHSDSELLVKQMSGEYRVKNADLRDLYEEAQDLLRRFESVRIDHVRREQNRRTDELCNLALDGNKPRPTAAAKPKAAKRPDSSAVREECVACLEAARGAWSARDPGAPTAEQVWEQLWSVLEEGGVLKKAKK